MTLHLTGARGKEGVGRGLALGGAGCLPGQGLVGIPQTKKTVVSGNPSEENTRPRAAQRPSHHMQTGRKYNTVYLSTFFKDLNG